MKHQGGTIYVRAKVAGKVIRQSIETKNLRIATMKRERRPSERGVDVETVAKWLGHKDGVLVMKT